MNLYAVSEKPLEEALAADLGLTPVFAPTRREARRLFAEWWACETGEPWSEWLPRTCRLVSRAVPAEAPAVWPGGQEVNWTVDAWGRQFCEWVPPEEAEDQRGYWGIDADRCRDRRLHGAVVPWQTSAPEGYDHADWD